MTSHKKADADLDAAVARTCYHHFQSTANQVEFYLLRDGPATLEAAARMKAIAEEEMELARSQFRWRACIQRSPTRLRIIITTRHWTWWKKRCNAVTSCASYERLIAGRRSTSRQPEGAPPKPPIRPEKPPPNPGSYLRP